MIEKLIEQAPWAAALVVVILAFIKYQISREKSHQQALEGTMRSYTARLNDMTGDMRESTDHFTKIGEDAVSAIGKNTMVLGDIKTSIVDLNGSIQDCKKAQELWKAILQEQREARQRTG